MTGYKGAVNTTGFKSVKGLTVIKGRDGETGYKGLEGKAGQARASYKIEVLGLQGACGNTVVQGERVGFGISG